MTKIQSHMMLVLHNLGMVTTNVKKKILNVTKLQSHMMLILYNVKIVPSNVMFF